MTSIKLFVDTSWFKALADPTDEFHSKAKQQFFGMKKSSVALFTSNYVLDETYTLIRIKVGLQSAIDFRQMLVNLMGVLTVVRVLDQDDSKAWDWFAKNWSKLSFTDCSSFAVMQRLELTTVATFDQHFERAGFEIYL